MTRDKQKIQSLEKEVQLLKDIVQALEKHIDTLLSRQLVTYIPQSPIYIQYPREDIIWCDSDTPQWSYTVS